MLIAQLVRGPVQDPETADQLLEIAYLAMAADGVLADEERDAFREIIGLFRGAPASEDDVRALLDRFAASAKAYGALARVGALAPGLPEPLKDVAFQISMGIALIDRDASPHEDAHLSTLASALGLDDEHADELAAEVRRVFSPPLSQPTMAAAAAIDGD